MTVIYSMSITKTTIRKFCIYNLSEAVGPIVHGAPIMIVSETQNGCLQVVSIFHTITKVYSNEVSYAATDRLRF
jgi:hypothetical protein